MWAKPNLDNLHFHSPNISCLSENKKQKKGGRLKTKHRNKQCFKNFTLADSEIISFKKQVATSKYWWCTADTETLSVPPWSVKTSLLEDSPLGKHVFGSPGSTAIQWTKNKWNQIIIILLIITGTYFCLPFSRDNILHIIRARMAKFSKLKP